MLHLIRAVRGEYLKEVGHISRIRHGRHIRVRSRFEFGVLRLHLLIVKANECALVPHLIAVVRSAEHSDALTVVINGVAFFLHLMRANQQLQIILTQEVGSIVRAEAKSHAAL